MNRDRWQAMSKQFGGALKECWGSLAGDPLAVAAGRRARTEGSIEERWAASNRAADRQLEEFMHRNRHWRDLSSR